jgi:dihydrofolate reductase
MTPEELQRIMAEQIRQQQEAQMRAMMGEQSGQEQYKGQQARYNYSIIAAIERFHGGFSHKGHIPWYYSEDFKHFRELTTDHVCIMGRNTYEDINKRLGDKAKDSVLPDRQCFVVSKTLTSLPNATVIPNIRHVEHHYEDTNKEIFIIGGRRLFIEGMAYVNHIHLTLINKQFYCDMYFPIKSLFKKFYVSKTVKSENPDLIFTTFTRK